ncbi:Transcription initiation factor IIB protein [Marine Group I thaumarchaeote SCGC AAA799-P11]|uniref:Transcription initiation factor IIB n=1 Tax=Marine Group I thaumarchaeote SCGC AAA799-P11 TaxID=1502295 RepID=A0A087RZ62_9ARCH|nr:Transcription initiation factor IIB protein [Marine Group I thaumarchaeote SCGC AAA799-P11]
MTQQLQNKEKCPRCGKNNLVTDNESGELFCGKCGLVIDEKISDNRPERMFSDSTVNKSRTGDRTSLTRHDQGLSTIISPINKDSSGNPLSASMKTSLKRLRVWDSRSRTKDSVDRNLQQALSELLKMKEKLSLSDVIVEKAAYIYRKALEKKLVKGRSISSLIAASLYAACRESGIPRTLNEISTLGNIRRKELSTCYRMLLKELDLRMPVVDSVSCIAKIASVAILSEKTKRYAMKILKKAEQEKILAGKDPMGMAAAALYLASLKMGEDITQKTIADAAGVTEVTVRHRAKNLKTIMN